MADAANESKTESIATSLDFSYIVKRKDVKNSFILISSKISPSGSDNLDLEATIVSYKSETKTIQATSVTGTCVTVHDKMFHAQQACADNVFPRIDLASKTITIPSSDTVKFDYRTAVKIESPQVILAIHGQMFRYEIVTNDINKKNFLKVLSGDKKTFEATKSDSMLMHIDDDAPGNPVSVVLSNNWEDGVFLYFEGRREILVDPSVVVEGYENLVEPPKYEELEYKKFKSVTVTKDDSKCSAKFELTNAAEKVFTVSKKDAGDTEFKPLTGKKNNVVCDLLYKQVLENLFVYSKDSPQKKVLVKIREDHGQIFAATTLTSKGEPKVKQFKSDNFDIHFNVEIEKSTTPPVSATPEDAKPTVSEGFPTWGYVLISLIIVMIAAGGWVVYLAVKKRRQN